MKNGKIGSKIHKRRRSIFINIAYCQYWLKIWSESLRKFVCNEVGASMISMFLKLGFLYFSSICSTVKEH